MTYLKNINPYSFLFLEIFILSIISILTIYYPISIMIPMTIIIPSFILIFLTMTFFEKLKLSTLVTGRILMALALLNILDQNGFLKIALYLLMINISEAAITDLTKSKNYFNFITGFALVCSVLIFFEGIKWEGQIYLLPTENKLAIIFWILAYTFWNWFFVCYEFNEPIAIYHIGVLITPIILCLFLQNPSVWLLLRSNSLNLAGSFQIVNKSFLEDKLKNEQIIKLLTIVKTKNFQFIGMIINLILILNSILLLIVK